ncbi:LacI family DNA-binding transcriptional regulator [Georgenia yuyongxinii]
MATDRPTLESVAAALGVSRQTVSNAINRPDVVAPATREAVLRAVREAGYVPSRAARQLRTARSRTLAIRMMPDFDGINGHILEFFLHELAEQARRQGYRLTLFAATDEDDEIAAYEDMFAAGDIDGVVLTSTHLGDRRIGWLLDRELPFVSFGRPWRTEQDVPDVPFDWVDVDGAAGTYAVVRRLVEAGHERLGYISWPVEPGVGGDRWQGWRRAMAEFRPDTDVDAWTVECPDDLARLGSVAAATLLGRGATALVCASDSLAIGASMALLESPGRHAAVVGFDDTPVARAVGLSSVSQPVAEAARTAVTLLLDRLAGRPQRRHVLLAPTPVFRDSALPPRLPHTHTIEEQEMP